MLSQPYCGVITAILTVLQGAKKIDFTQFSEALALIAAEKGVPICDITAAVQHCGGPGFNTTTPDALRRTITGDTAAITVG